MARGAGIAALAVVGAVAARAEAHQVGLSRGEYAFDGQALRAEITFARGELLSIAPSLDTDRSGVLSEAELAGGRAALEGAVVARVAASVAGASCRGSFARARLTEEDGAAVTIAFACPAGKAARVELPLLEELEHGHRHVARAHTLAGETEEVLFRGHAGFDVALGPPLAPLPSAAATPPPAAAPPGGTRGGAFAETFACALAVALGGEDVAGRAAVLASFAAGVAAGHGVVALGWLSPPPLVASVVAAATLVPAGLGLAAPRTSRASRGARGWAAAASLGLAHGVVSGAGGFGPVAVVVAVGVVAIAIATLKRPLPVRVFAVLGALFALAGVADAALRLARR